MNEYKLLVVSNGYVQTVYLNATDISQAVYGCGYSINDVIRIELVGSTNVIDNREVSGV